jgi:hypothetical protein
MRVGVAEGTGMGYGNAYPHSGEHLAFLWLPYIASLASVLAVAALAHAMTAELLLVHIILGSLGLITSAFVVNAECWSPAGYAATISRISASILPEGYVFMFVALTMFAYLFCRRVNYMAWVRNGGTSIGIINRSPRCTTPSVTDRVMMIGVMLTVVTGIVPDKADNCDLDGDHQVDSTVDECGALFVRLVHIIGIGIGIATSASTAAVRAVYIFKLHKDQSPEVYNQFRLRVAFGIFISSAVLVIIFLIVFMGVIQPQVKEAQSMHLCIIYSTKDTCEGTGLPQTWRDATADVNMSWPCVWNEAALVTDPYPCTNPTCGEDVLRMNSNCVISEFNLLMFWLTTMMLVLLLMEAEASGVWQLVKKDNENKKGAAGGDEDEEKEQVSLDEMMQPEANSIDVEIPQQEDEADVTVALRSGGSSAPVQAPRANSDGDMTDASFYCNAPGSSWDKGWLTCVETPFRGHSESTRVGT